MGDGNCLLHAASVAMWGVQDRERVLRRRLAGLLRGEPQLRDRWRQHFARRNRADGAHFNNPAFLQGWVIPPASGT